MYERILIYLSDEGPSRAAIDEGLALARIHGSEVFFACVLPSFALPLADMPLATLPLPDDFEPSARRSAEALLQQAREKAQAAGIASRQEIAQGPEDAATVLQMAQAHRCQLIVVASAGHNAVMRLLTGSVISGLVTLSPIPLLICRGTPPNKTGAH